MQVPDYLASHYEMWRASVERGNSVEARANDRNATAHARNIAGMIDVSPAIAAALHHAERESQAYFHAQSDLFAKPSNATALAALDDLAAALVTAKANAVTRALGIA